MILDDKLQSHSQTSGRSKPKYKCNKTSKPRHEKLIPIPSRALNHKDVAIDKIRKILA